MTAIDQSVGRGKACLAPTGSVAFSIQIGITMEESVVEVFRILQSVSAPH